MKIAVDIDEVVAEYLDGYLKFLEARHNIVLQREDFFSYDFWEVIGYSKQTDIDRVDQYYKTKYFDEMQPSEDAVKSLKKLVQKHQIYFITARPSEWKQKTEIWLSKYFKGMDYKVIYLALAHKKNHEGKGAICRAHDINIIFEDRFDYAQDCAEKDIKVILFDKPWNKDFKVEKNIYRVKNWPQALSVFKELTE